MSIANYAHLQPKSARSYVLVVVRGTALTREYFQKKTKSSEGLGSRRSRLTKTAQFRNDLIAVALVMANGELRSNDANIMEDAWQARVLALR